MPSHFEHLRVAHGDLVLAKDMPDALTADILIFEEALGRHSPLTARRPTSSTVDRPRASGRSCGTGSSRHSGPLTTAPPTPSAGSSKTQRSPGSASSRPGTVITLTAAMSRADCFAADLHL